MEEAAIVFHSSTTFFLFAPILISLIASYYVGDDILCLKPLLEVYNSSLLRLSSVDQYTPSLLTLSFPIRITQLLLTKNQNLGGHLVIYCILYASLYPIRKSLPQLTGFRGDRLEKRVIFSLIILLLVDQKH